MPQSSKSCPLENDAIVPADEKSKFLDLERPELKKIVDFCVSSAVDVYVPTSSNLFSDNAVARRIATGKTQVLVPANRSSLSAEDIVTRVKHKLFVVNDFFVHFLIAQAYLESVNRDIGCHKTTRPLALVYSS
nr:protein MANNAN SYNTHESIS-RELATED 1-like [Ipomoea batatas]